MVGKGACKRSKQSYNWSINSNRPTQCIWAKQKTFIQCNKLLTRFSSSFWIDNALSSLCVNSLLLFSLLCWSCNIYVNISWMINEWQDLQLHVERWKSCVMLYGYWHHNLNDAIINEWCGSQQYYVNSNMNSNL